MKNNYNIAMKHQYLSKNTTLTRMITMHYKKYYFILLHICANNQDYPQNIIYKIALCPNDYCKITTSGRESIIDCIDYKDYCPMKLSTFLCNLVVSNMKSSFDFGENLKFRNTFRGETLQFASSKKLPKFENKIELTDKSFQFENKLDNIITANIAHSCFKIAPMLCKTTNNDPYVVLHSIGALFDRIIKYKEWFNDFSTITDVINYDTCLSQWIRLTKTKHMPLDVIHLIITFCFEQNDEKMIKLKGGFDDNIDVFNIICSRFFGHKDGVGSFMFFYMNY